VGVLPTRRENPAINFALCHNQLANRLRFSIGQFQSQIELGEDCEGKSEHDDIGFLFGRLRVVLKRQPKSAPSLAIDSRRVPNSTGF